MRQEYPEVRERHLRERAAKYNWYLIKDRSDINDAEHRGGYRIVDLRNNIKKGRNFELSLDDVQKFLDELP